MLSPEGKLRQSTEQPSASLQVPPIGMQSSSAAPHALPSISVAAVLLAYHGKVTLGKYAMYF